MPILLRDGKWKYLLSFISKANCSFFKCKKQKQLRPSSLAQNVKIERQVFKCTMSTLILLFLFSKVMKLHEAMFCKQIIWQIYYMTKLTDKINIFQVEIVNTVQSWKVPRINLFIEILSIARHQSGDTILIWSKPVEFRIKVFQRYSNEVWASLPPERKCLISKRRSSRGRRQQLGRTTKY